LPKTFVAEQAYFLEAPPETVFQALTDPKILVKWFLSKAKLVQRKGGSYTFDWIGGYRMTNKVKRFEPNKTVSFSWIDKLKNGEVARTTASFVMAKKGNGTMLKLRHTGFKDPEHFADCSSRWAYYLTNMKSVLDHGVDLRSKLDR
jgi:uncharacterized protein YndB with AHSA1/START domain